MPVLQAFDLCVETPDARPLIHDLNLQIGRDRVAVLGRNGVGKSTLFAVLARVTKPASGRLVHRGTVTLVPQELEGERRANALRLAFGSEPDLLLLDEPSRGLDNTGRRWLLRTLGRWKRSLMVVSHDPEVLTYFNDFFVIEESGCQHLHGTYQEVQERRARLAERHQRCHDRSLHRLAQQELHHHRVQRRRERKRAVGRCHELDRCQSKARLNKRRSSAQVSQAKVRAIASARLFDKRRWAQATRRAMAVELPLRVLLPVLGPPTGPAICMVGAFTHHQGASIGPIDLEVERERIAIVDPNSAALLGLMAGRIQPTTGSVRIDPTRIGSIGPPPKESLISRLSTLLPNRDQAARHLVAHGFPLALAQRPLRTLSPGEYTRASLIHLFLQPGLEVLLLDEPTRSLDVAGVVALTKVLQSWLGGLVVATHDTTFLAKIGVERRLTPTGFEPVT